MDNYQPHTYMYLFSSVLRLLVLAFILQLKVEEENKFWWKFEQLSRWSLIFLSSLLISFSSLHSLWENFCRFFAVLHRKILQLLFTFRNGNVYRHNIFGIFWSLLICTNHLRHWKVCSTKRTNFTSAPSSWFHLQLIDCGK